MVIYMVNTHTALRICSFYLWGIHTHTHTHILSSLVVQLVKNPIAMQETPGQFLGLEDPLEKGYASLVAQMVKNLPAV